MAPADSNPPLPPLPPDGAPQLDLSDDQQIVLVKNGQRYPFACPPGGELRLLQHLRELVADPGCAINWFDAAVLSHEVGERMSARLEEHTQRKRVG